MVNLTPQERDRFAAWLEWEAKTDNGLVEQMAKLNLPEPMIKRKRAMATAKMMVAIDLRSWEEQTISGALPTPQEDE